MILSPKIPGTYPRKGNRIQIVNSGNRQRTLTQKESLIESLKSEYLKSKIYKFSELQLTND